MQPEPTPPIVSYPDPNTYEPPAVVLGYVVIKGLGLWFVLSMVQVLAIATTAMGNGTGLQLNQSGVHSIWQILPPLGYVLAGVMLMAFALPLARRVFRLPGHVVPMLQGETMVGLISVGVGIYLAASSAGHVLRGLFDLFLQIRNSGGRLRGDFVSAWWINSVIDLAIGLFLFLRPNWIVGHWRTWSRMP